MQGLGAIVLTTLRLTEPTGDAVTWADPAGVCPEIATLPTRAEQLLGRPVEPAEVTVRLTVLEGSPLRARIELSFQGDHEVRDIEGPDCAALLDAAALMIAVTLDPPSVPEPEVGPEPEVEPEPEAEPVPEVEPTPEVEPVPEAIVEPEPGPEPAPEQALPLTEADPEPSPSRLGVSLGLAVGGELGAIPRGTGGLRPSVRLTRGRFEAQVAGAYWIRRQRSVRSTGEGVAVELGTAALLACGLIRRERVAIPLCGGAEAGAMHGVGLGLRNGRSDVQPWVAAVVTGEARLRVSRWVALEAIAEVYGAFVRPRFEAQASMGPVLLHAPSPVGGRLMLGVVLGGFFRDGKGSRMGVSTSE